MPIESITLCIRNEICQKEIDEMFPTTITQEAFGRLNRKNQIGDLAN